MMVRHNIKQRKTIWAKLPKTIVDNWIITKKWYATMMFNHVIATHNYKNVKQYGQYSKAKY